MMRRSTSLAVCCAPISTMPSERPRSATSSRISLIGESPSRGAYLFSSSSTTNSSGLAEPGLLLAVERAAQRDADDEALGAVGEVVQVDDGDLRVVGLDAVAARARATSARTMRSSARCDESSRRTNALTVPSPVAAPAHTGRSTLVGDLGDDEVDEVAVGAQRLCRRSATRRRRPAAP